MEQRSRAAQAFDELKAAGLIHSSLSDLVDPESWCEITAAGREALERRTLDTLDDALAKISPHFLHIRRGAWSALASKQPDSLRQAAHSARELIDQVLREGAPDDRIKNMPWYKADPSSRTGVTPRMRVKFLMEQFHCGTSDTDVAIAEAACDLVLTINDKLMAQAHGRSAPSYLDVTLLLDRSWVATGRSMMCESTSGLPWNSCAKSLIMERI